MMESRLVKIGAAARMIGTRDYAVSDLLGPANETALTLCYARVSSHEQKADPDRQQKASLKSSLAWFQVSSWRFLF